MEKTDSISKPSHMIPESDDPLIALDKPELVFGIVGPVGTDRKAIYEILSQELIEYGYKAYQIKVSSILHQIENLEDLENIKNDEFERIRVHMDAGTKLRQSCKRGDALALLSVSEIRACRKKINEETDSSPVEGATLADKAIPSTAYVLDSLKHPDEIESLRAIYGRAFIMISVFTPREARINALAERIAQSKLEPQNAGNYRFNAEQLVQIDEKEPGTKLGQSVRSAFPLADFFVEASHVPNTEKALARLLELIFNNPFVTPSQDEYGMFFAESSAWRSGDLARQVGAAILSQEGELLSVGCNEVPKPYGGYYWDSSTNDARDLALGYDSGTKQKQLMVAEILKRIKDSDYFDPTKKAEIDRVIENTIDGKIDKILDDVQALNVIEYGRAVHAEMASLCDAAKRGISVNKATMYVNTFPCHICARHILASGISKLVFIEPYPKSLTEQLYNHQIDTKADDKVEGKISFKPFCGVAPRFYQFVFQLTAERKLKSGTKSTWTKAKARPKLKRYVLSYIAIEQQVVAKLTSEITNQASKLKISKNTDGHLQVLITGDDHNGEKN